MGSISYLKERKAGQGLGIIENESEVQKLENPHELLREGESQGKCLGKKENAINLRTKKTMNPIWFFDSHSSSVGIE